jgi:hypothetical protein
MAGWVGRDDGVSGDGFGWWNCFARYPVGVGEFGVHGHSICSWNARVGIVFLVGLLGRWRTWCFLETAFVLGMRGCELFSSMAFWGGGELLVSWKQHLFLECEGGRCFAQGPVGLVGMSEFPAMPSGGGEFGVNGNSICSWNARVGIVFLDGLLGWWRISCFLETAFVPGI